MYLAFTEEQAVAIRKTGVSVVEYKLCLKKGINVASHALLDVCAKIEELFTFLFDSVRHFVDDIKFLIEEAFDNMGCRTSTRYQMVKFFSKCQKVDRYRIWRVSRDLIRFARSNC